MKIKKLIAECGILFVLFALAMAGWNIDFLKVIDSNSTTLFCMPMTNGQKLIAKYTHSVEKTEVEDEYIIVDSRIWAWEERVKSSNAGMPSVLAPRMKFLKNDDWMIFRGGGISWDTFAYRVGNDEFGRNRIVIGTLPEIDIYKIFPSRRLLLTVDSKPYLLGIGECANNLR